MVDRGTQIANRLRAIGYYGDSREVLLTGAPHSSDTVVDHLLEEAKRIGYKPVKNTLVNLVNPNSLNDEHTPTLLMEGPEGKEGIIVTRNTTHQFYSDGNWSYIA